MKLGLAERRRHLVLHHLDPGFVANHLITGFDRANAANIEPYGRIELEGVPTRRGLRAAEHDTDLHANLVDKNHHAVGALDATGDLPQCLRHQAGLQTNVLVAHLTINFRFGRERGNGVHHNEVYGTRAHQHVDDFERLLSGVGLRHQQVVEVDP